MGYGVFLRISGRYNLQAGVVVGVGVAVAVGVLVGGGVLVGVGVRVGVGVGGMFGSV